MLIWYEIHFMLVCKKNTVLGTTSFWARKKERSKLMELYIHLHSMRFLKKQEFPNIFFLHSRRKLTFWSAFSFSSKLWVAVSRLVWVWANSFSNCCIFFSRASTSSLAYLATIRQRTKMFFFREIEFHEIFSWKRLRG